MKHSLHGRSRDVLLSILLVFLTSAIEYKYLIRLSIITQCKIGRFGIFVGGETILINTQKELPRYEK